MGLHICKTKVQVLLPILMIVFPSPSDLLTFQGHQHFCTERLIIFPFHPTQRAAGVLSRTLSSSRKIVEEALRAGVVKKMIKFLKVD